MSSRFGVCKAQVDIAVSEAKMARGGISRKFEMQITRHLRHKSKICFIQSRANSILYTPQREKFAARVLAACRPFDRDTEIKGLRGRYTSKLGPVPIIIDALCCNRSRSDSRCA